MMAHEITTVEELLKRWDSGQSVFTIELGGLGPGYEQAIQIAAIEFARANQSEPMTRSERDHENWDKKCTEVLRKIDDQLGGLSGAMFGTAKWLAYQWCFNGGPAALIERAKKEGKEDQVIQVSKVWPKAPEPQTYAAH